MATQQAQEYSLRSELASIQRQMREETDPTARKVLFADLTSTQEKLLVLQQPDVAEAVAKDLAPAAADQGRVELSSLPSSVRSGAEYKISVGLGMKSVPTSIYHLYDVGQNPLVTASINLKSLDTGRVRVVAYIEEYSARAVATIDLVKRNQSMEVSLLPTLFPDRVRAVHELTRATVNVEIENIAATRTTEHHVTIPIWMLPANSTPLQIQDPRDKIWKDMTRFTGALVTPYDREVLAFLRTVLNHSPGNKLDGYRGDVRGQVEAIFTALKKNAEIRYVDSVNDFNPDSGYNTQRVRLPRETLKEQQANCIDGTLLYASLLEAIGINPVLVFVPEHVFVGWETGQESNEWDYVETTWIGDEEKSFDAAVEQARWLHEVYTEQRKLLENPDSLREWPLRELRTKYSIWPTA